MTTSKYLTSLGVIVSLSLAAAPAAFAKGHNQGATEVPGTNVGEQTVEAAQNEGAEQRSDNAPEKADRTTTPGNSGSAGRPQE